MPGPAHPRFGSTLPIGTDPVDIVDDMDDAVTPLLELGLRIDEVSSALPGTHIAKRGVWVTSTSRLYYDDGVNYTLLNPSTAAGGVTPSSIEASDTGTEGVSTAFARADHQHAFVDFGIAAATLVLNKDGQVTNTTGTRIYAGLVARGIWHVDARLTFLAKSDNFAWILNGTALPTPLGASEGGGPTAQFNNMVIPGCVRVSSQGLFDLMWDPDVTSWYVSSGNSPLTAAVPQHDQLWVVADYAVA